MSVYQELIDKLHLGKNPYTGFPSGWEGVWFGDPGAQREIFIKCLNKLMPHLVIELGSFVGESAIYMAKHIQKKKWDAAIVCVDTWYGGFDHFVGAREKLQMHFGRADLFYRFMANVIANKCQDVIVPLAMDSINAARVLKQLGISTRLAYIDASHERGDVLRDYEAYWDLLYPGGGMLVDDLSNHFPGVLHDYDVFMRNHDLKPSMTEGEKALIIKP